MPGAPPLGSATGCTKMTEMSDFLLFTKTANVSICVLLHKVINYKTISNNTIENTPEN